MRRSLGLTLTATALTGGTALADWLAVRRWRQNPDPLDGRTPMFPEGPQRWVITDDDANIHTVTVEPAGPSAGTIVLVHGLTSSLEDFGPIAEHLLELGFTVVGVDQRGHGKSMVGSAGYGPNVLAADLASVLTQLDISDAMVVGHSMGGMATMALALNHRSVMNDRVRSVGLLSTAASMNAPLSELSLRLGRLSVSDRIYRLGDKLRLAVGLLAFGDKPSLFMVDQGIRTVQLCPDVTRREATDGLVDFDITDRIATIAVPALVVHGTADRMLPVDMGRFIAQTIPDAELRVLDGAGHMMIWEQWQTIAERIASFYDESDLDGYANDGHDEPDEYNDDSLSDRTESDL